MDQVAAEKPLLYEHEEAGDHPDGGACIRVFKDESQVERLDRYSDEYTAALAALIVAANGEASGWQFAAPAVFLAHHACELALKVRWLRYTDDEPAGFRIHDLHDIATEVEQAGGWTGLSIDDRAKLDVCIGRLREVTRDGISIRYAEIDERWCCLNLGALVDLVDDVRALARAPDC